MKNLTTQIEAASYKELIEVAKSLNLLKLNNVSIYQIKKEDLRIQLLQQIKPKAVEKVTKKSITLDMFKSGKSRREIAEKLNTHISYVRTIVREAGLSVKPKTTQKTKIIEMFKSGKSRKEIAVDLNTHISYVRTVVREASLSEKS